VNVRIDDAAVHAIADRAGAQGVEAAGRFLADQQRDRTRSSRLASAVRWETGRDSRGWFARVGMLGVGPRHPAFFWYFEEYRTGAAGGHRPFIRPALWDNTQRVARMLTGGPT
jgi:hypothetical protein